MISQFLQPSFNILIGEVLSNIIDQKSTHSSTVVAEETNKLLKKIRWDIEEVGQELTQK